MPRTGRPKIENPGYHARHLRVKVARGRASEYQCTDCGFKARDWALIHGRDGMDVMDYQPMCHKCHFAYDRGGVPHTPEHRAKLSAAALLREARKRGDASGLPDAA